MPDKTDAQHGHATDGTAFDLRGPSKAPCVVLIHGLGLTRSVWDPVTDAFVGFRVLRYDLYGHGASAPSSRAVDLALFARQILDLMDHLGIEAAHLVGFSIGGMINRRFALDAPTRALSLAILNSPHDRGEDAQHQVELRAKAAADQGAFATFDAALQRWFTPEYLTKGSGPARVREWRHQVNNKSYAETSWVLANGVRELIAPEPPIRKPALVMTCENDVGSTPKMSHAIGAEIAGANVLIVPRLKHLGILEHPDAFAKPLRMFLKSV